MRRPTALALLSAVIGAIGVGTAVPPASAASGPKAVDWPTFDLNAQHTGVAPATGITAGNVHRLKRQTITIPGTVDSSPIELAGVKVKGRKHNVFFLTTSYGKTLAIDVATGHTLWTFAPTIHLTGSAQMTTAAPVADPSRRYIYAATPDGFVHKLSVSSGRQLWSTRVTYDPQREKLDGSLNVTGASVLVVTGGYYGDAPSYQGHVALLNRSNGHITHVWNSLCSNIKTLIDPPSKCPASDSAIWGRPGAIVEPGTGNILVATSNGPFDGHTNWGDSVIELSPALRLLHNWTPTDQAKLDSQDIDLGSTSPALLNMPGGLHFAVQGGKDGMLHLLNLARLDGTTRGAGPRTGGEMQDIDAPGTTDVFSQPIVDRIGGHYYVFATTDSGQAGYEVDGKHRLKLIWQNSRPGTSPVIAGGLLYIYDMTEGVLDVRNPQTGRLYASLPAKSGHWNSPIVDGGTIILPEGNDMNHLQTGTIDIYRLPRG